MTSHGSQNSRGVSVDMTDEATKTARSNTAAIGPLDRESFFDAQRRNRRATWRMSALCILGTLLAGIPLSLILTPILYALTLIAADIVNYFSPLPAEFWRHANEIARIGVMAGNWLFEGKPADVQTLGLGAAAMLLPGVILSVTLWLGVNALFRHGGVGGALLALRAREPSQADLKELRLADVVQEMAIAAGLPTPRVILVDAPGANAAAIGTSAADARIVVSRRLVDELNRDELEGALAHLIASIGNGDLQIAFRVTSIFETCGLLVAMINSPFGPQSRRTLWRILRYGLGGRKSAGGAEEAAAVAALLTRNADLETDDIDRLFDPAPKRSALRSIRNFLLFPIFFTNAAIKLLLWFLSSLLLEPSVALLWRTREYLADASAVQLTRNPDGLAAALQKLNKAGGAIPGGEWAAHLFLISTACDKRTAGEPDANQKQVMARAWAASAPNKDEDTPRQRSDDFSRVAKEVAAARQAAIAGDQQAIARMVAFNQTMKSALGLPVADRIPNPVEIAAARRGDAAALARLRGLSLNGAAQSKADDEPQQSSGMSGIGFLSFHPPLTRRLKRLDRMGAHAELASGGRKPLLFAIVLSLVLGLPALLAAGLFLVLIAAMTMASFTFLVLWLAVIHKVLGLLAHR